MLASMPHQLPLSVSLLTAVAVMAACQAFKAVLYSVRGRRLDLSWLISAGGMPSAHSAFVAALAASVGLWNGFGSELFGVAAVLAALTVYDAKRLRGAVEHHARILVDLAARHPEVRTGPINVRLGHSGPEIAAGLAAGAGLAVLAWLLLGGTYPA
jgi:uncharacterized protein